MTVDAIQVRTDVATQQCGEREIYSIIALYIGALAFAALLLTL